MGSRSLYKHVNEHLLVNSLITVLKVSTHKIYSYFQIIDTGENYYYDNASPLAGGVRTILFIRNLDLHGFLQKKKYIYIYVTSALDVKYLNYL